MRHLSLFLSVVAIMLFSVASARAASGDVFVVVRVPVQAQGEGATAAKANAQAQGRRRAMDILLRRLTPEDDWVYLPKLADGAEAQSVGDGANKSAVVIGPEQLEALEAGFEVYGEKTSSRLYRALITYRFKPDAVRRLLKNSGIPYSEAQTRTALVLPVLQTDKNVYLWEENNPWMAAWKSRPYTHELTPMIAPLGDLEDRAKITARGALSLDQDGLTAIAAHYGVSQVVIAHARLKQADGNDQLSVRLINGYRESGKADGSDIGLDTGSDTPDANQAAFGIGQKQQDDDFAAEVGDVLAQSYLTRPSGNFPGLAEMLIDASIAKYASGWKAKTLIDHASESVLGVSAFFDNIGDWSRIRAALIASPLVGSAQISALSRRGAEMNVRVFGDPSRLQVSMENQGIVFWTENNDRWFLATPQVASRYRGRRFLRGRRGLFGENDPGNAGEFDQNDVDPRPASFPEQREGEPKLDNIGQQ